MCKHYISALELHLTDGTRAPVISQLSTVYDFHKITTDNNTFRLHSYRVLLAECFVAYSAITAYLLTTFSHNFVAVKTLLMSLQNII